MQPSDSVRPSRAIVLLAIALTFLGTCGVGNGIGAFQDQPPLPAADEADSAPADMEDATEAFQRAAAEEVLNSPLRRPLAAANVVVSAMLLVGAFMLFGRRSQAPWWITQAALANALWILLDAGNQMARLLGASDRLVPLIERTWRAGMAEQGTPLDELPVGGEAQLWILAIMVAGLATLRIAVYALIAWRVRRRDVRELLAPAESTG